jgi:hypothetical protein
VAAEESKKKKRKRNNNANSSVKIHINDEDLEQMEDFSEFTENHQVTIPIDLTNPETTSNSKLKKSAALVNKSATKITKPSFKSVMLQTSTLQMDEPILNI